MHPKDAEEIANSVDPDQTAPLEQSDLGLHCLPRPICLKTFITVIVCPHFVVSHSSILCLGLGLTLALSGDLFIDFLKNVRLKQGKKVTIISRSDHVAERLVLTTSDHWGQF